MTIFGAYIVNPNVSLGTFSSKICRMIKQSGRLLLVTRYYSDQKSIVSIFKQLAAAYNCLDKKLICIVHKKCKKIKQQKKQTEMKKS